MTYILDANALSALMKGDESLIDHLQKVGKDSVTIPQPVVAEIAYGIARLTKLKRKAILRERLDLLIKELGRIEWTDEVSESFGWIKAALEKKGQRIEDFDVAIAAHALAANAILVTANLDQMRRVPGLHVEDWSQP